ncbi:MAG: Gx transporter family protein [Thermotoga caldifontis]|uniref:Gx transporter family protein n=1 Tax=Thermotoga caldifontis TaxID=1508419 RepID=UPI003C797BDA
MNVRRLALISSLASLGSVIYFLETFVPFPLPYGRWGLSNLVVLIAVMLYDFKTVLAVSLLKSVVGSLITGRLFSIVSLMSVAGSVAAATSEYIAYRSSIFGLVGISVLGSVANNVAQALVGAMSIRSWSFLLILPQMLFLGVPGAILNAYLAERVVRRAKDNFGFSVAQESADNEHDTRKIRNHRTEG